MLQRVAVRRMILEIRRLVREVAKGFLFEQNKESTTKAFENSVRPLVQRMVNAGGISKFKVKIDTSTTSQVDIENNVVRGMVFLQPTKSDEIIQVDFST
jgi:phage tail sheath protein FI